MGSNFGVGLGAFSQSFSPYLYNHLLTRAQTRQNFQAAGFNKAVESNDPLQIRNAAASYLGVNPGAVGALPATATNFPSGAGAVASMGASLPLAQAQGGTSMQAPSLPISLRQATPFSQEGYTPEQLTGSFTRGFSQKDAGSLAPFISPAVNPPNYNDLVSQAKTQFPGVEFAPQLSVKGNKLALTGLKGTSKSQGLKMTASTGPLSEVQRIAAENPEQFAVMKVGEDKSGNEFGRLINLKTGSKELGGIFKGMSEKDKQRALTNATVETPIDPNNIMSPTSKTIDPNKLFEETNKIRVVSGLKPIDQKEFYTELVKASPETQPVDPKNISGFVKTGSKESVKSETFGKEVKKFEEAGINIKELANQSNDDIETKEAKTEIRKGIAKMVKEGRSLDDIKEILRALTIASPKLRKIKVFTDNGN